MVRYTKCSKGERRLSPPGTCSFDIAILDGDFSHRQYAVATGAQEAFRVRREHEAWARGKQGGRELHDPAGWP